MNRIAVLPISVAATVLLVLSGCSQAPTVKGEVTTHLLNLAGSMTDYKDAMECKTMEDSFHEEISDGAEIFAYNETGEVVGKGKLGAGVRSNTDPQTTDLDCKFPFTISGISGDTKFVTLELGSNESDPYSKDELAEPISWMID